MKVDVKNIDTHDFGFDISDVEAGDIFIDGSGEVMFMTQDSEEITEEDYVDEPVDEDMPIGSCARIAYRLKDGSGWIYSEDESIQRVLEFAKIVE